MNPIAHEAVMGKAAFDLEVKKQVKIAKAYGNNVPKVVGKPGNRVLVTGNIFKS